MTKEDAAGKAAEEYAQKRFPECDDRVDEECKRIVIKDFLAGIQHARRWIPCSERLPEKRFGHVLIFSPQCLTPIRVSFYCDGRFAIDGVTHWQQLPEPPEMGE